MPGDNRLVAVVLEVADLERSVRLYRDAFGIALKDPDEHVAGDRWVGGLHCATSWTEGEYIHFALYEAKDDGPTTRAQVSFRVDDIDTWHARAVAAGAEVLHEPRAEEWGRSARYRG